MSNEDLGPLGWASRRMIIGGLVAVFLLVIGVGALLFFFAADSARAPTRSALLAAAPLKYYGVDRAAPVDYPWLSEQGIGFVVVSFDVNGAESTWRSILAAAQANGVDVVIWPSDWTHPRVNCNWEAPYPVSTNGDISRVKRLMDVASEYQAWIGIINAHESFWTCAMTFDEMAGLKVQLREYALSKGRSDVRVWNYINSLYTESKFPASQIPRVGDVMVTWAHFASGINHTFAGAKAQIARDRARLENIPGVELVFLIQTFTIADAAYTVKFTLPQLETYSCEIIGMGALDGFGYYTWSANWWSDLSEWPELWPAIPHVRTCSGAPPITTTPQPATLTPTRTRAPTLTRTAIPPTRTATPPVTLPPECYAVTFQDGIKITVCK